LYVVFVVLEVLGVLTPYQMPELSSRLAWIGLFILAAVMMVTINRQFIAYLAYALSASLKREESLTEMSQRVQASVEAERAAQAQTVENAQQLQEVAHEYVMFLERIAAGDYSASLDLSALAERPNLPQELVSLGEYINTTVASLVSTLDEARNAQRTYMRQSWESLMEAGRVPGGYRYSMDAASETSRVEIAEDAWLPPMTEAVRSKDVTVGKDELAIPIASGVRAQLIGALGVRRIGQEEWSEDELALVTTVTDQLAQTLENLRLLDETTRRAAREQMAGEITGHIREAVEIEAVLERALSELGRAFAAERGSVYLALGEQEKA
jgi:GAF domain-containing protein